MRQLIFRRTCEWLEIGYTYRAVRISYLVRLAEDAHIHIGYCKITITARGRISEPNAVAFTSYIIRMSFSASNNFYYCRYCGCPACVCVCLFVGFCRHVHLDRDVRIHRGTENASFGSYGVICLPRMPLTTPEPQNTDTNGIHATWA